MATPTDIRWKVEFNRKGTQVLSTLFTRYLFAIRLLNPIGSFIYQGRKYVLWEECLSTVGQRKVLPLMDNYRFLFYVHLVIPLAFYIFVRLATIVVN